MKLSKMFAAVLAFSLTIFSAAAQDVVVISEGNFVRGTIQGTDYSNVAIKQEDAAVALYKAKDIKEFLWNGETYVSKPIVVKKKMEHRFFKLIEHGAVNLYSIGGSAGTEQPEPKRTKVRPSFGVGGGTGGFGGLGGGVSISLGGGRSRGEEGKVAKERPTGYFIERFGTGPMLEIPVEGGNSNNKTQHIKNVLLQKLTNDEDLAERIKATESFDAKLIRAFVSAYNGMNK
jgi:hypothetical protein